MFQHFLLVAGRNLLKKKFYSILNIVGLAIGMACCVLIAFYVQHELSYDHYNTKHERIYRVLQTFRSVEKGKKSLRLRQKIIGFGAMHRLGQL